MSGSGKVGFAAGLCVGLLVGSRSGRGLYDKSAATANSLMHDPRVRRGATTAAQRAGEAGTMMAGAAARQVKRVRNGHEAEDERDTLDASAADSGMGMRSGGKDEGDDARAAARAAGARDANKGMGRMESMQPAGAAHSGSAHSGHGHGNKHGHGGDHRGSGSSNSANTANASAQPRQTGMTDGARDERAD